MLLAKLFTKPHNLLVLDEPTNDLDLEMLEVLEAQLVTFEGTLIVVSHDRAFLDNVVTSVLVFEESGVQEYVGGYEDWKRRGRTLRVAESGFASEAPAEAIAPAVTAPLPAVAEAPAKARAKLSYKLKRELEALPEEIERLEGEVEARQAAVSGSDFFPATGPTPRPTWQPWPICKRRLRPVLSAGWSSRRWPRGRARRLLVLGSGLEKREGSAR